MQTKLSRPDIDSLIARLQAQSRSVTPSATNFVLTAVYCQVNEGIEPFVTAALRYRAFHFTQMWAEFTPLRSKTSVRRRLTVQTAEHLQRQFRETGAGPDDLVHRYTPRRYKNANAVRKNPVVYNMLIRQQIKCVDCDPARFSHVQLKWFWLDQHPTLRDQEKRATILAQFVLRWASPHQQEALLRRIYDNISILRPSWAYPKWHVAADHAIPSPLLPGIRAEAASAPPSSSAIPVQ